MAERRQRVRRAVQERRGDGTTTRQMQDAPIGSLYIVGAGPPQYYYELAKRLSRTDLKIVGPDYLDSGAWRGLKLRGITIDHAWTPERRHHDLLVALQTGLNRG